MTLGGIIPPVPTPFSQTGQLDLATFQQLLRALEPEVDGFLILGSNGEAIYLSEAERSDVLRAAREVIPADKPMLAGTGGEATQLVEQRNVQASEIGADYVLVLPPHYFLSRMTEQALLAHYRHLADSSPTPLLLYNVPANTTLSLSPTLIAELAKHENIHGLKDSSGNIVNLTEIMRRVPRDFTVMTGNAPTLLPALSLGVKGGILAVANLAAKAYRDIMACIERGELDRARELQLELNPLALAVTTQYGVAGLKAALRLQGRDAGYPRAPLLEVTSEEEHQLQDLLELIP